MLVSDTPHLSYARTGLYSTLQASPNLAWFRAVRQVPRLRSELRIAVVVMRAGVVGLPGGLRLRRRRSHRACHARLSSSLGLLLVFIALRIALRQTLLHLYSNAAPSCVSQHSFT